MSRTGSKAERPLALTVGDPAGIGPDLAATLAMRPRAVPWVALGDPAMLAERARTLEFPVTIEEWAPGEPVPEAAGTLPVLSVPLRVPARAGEPDPANAAAVLATLDRAVDGCRDGVFRGIVTGPIAKSVIADAGIPFTGHTEYFAERAGGTPVMMLVSRILRVALVTTHLPLREVADAITGERVETVVRIVADDLRRRFAVAKPRLAVLGLNPHAGENGHLGREEIEFVEPALERLRRAGLDITGPVPADTAFTPAALARCDAVVAMYHDQGLPVLKHAGFGSAVNCTLGLPMVRTSVDHGTAFDLAGSGRADPGSLQEAFALAALMAANELDFKP